MSVAHQPLLDFSPWSFLTAPLDDLLDRLDARVREVSTNDGHVFGGIVRRDWGLQISVPADANPIEKDIAARGLLAQWFYIDTSGWPLDMQFTELGSAE